MDRKTRQRGNQKEGWWKQKTGFKNRFKKHGGKEDRDKSEKTEKVKVQPEHKPMEKMMKQATAI